jgi:hypothetical protein
MTIVEQAHFAMDYGTLTISPADATVDEIKQAFRKAKRLEKELTLPQLDSYEDGPIDGYDY